MKSLILFLQKTTVTEKLLLLITPLITIILSMKVALVGLLILILLDLLTGIRKNNYLNKVKFNIFKEQFWVSIKSYLLRKTWRKSYEYGLGIIVIMVFESLIFGVTTISLFSQTFTLSELIIVIPAFIEVWSIFENLEAVSGRNILKRIKFLLPEKVRKFIDKEK